MNETSNPPPLVPGGQRITVLGVQMAASSVTTAASDQATQVLGTDSSRVGADLCGHHLRAHETCQRDSPARISKSSGAVPHSGAFTFTSAA